MALVRSVKFEIRISKPSMDSDVMCMYNSGCVLEFILSQYLESVRPLLDDKDYQEMEALVKDFKVTRSHGMKKLVCRT